MSTLKDFVSDYYTKGEDYSIVAGDTMTKIAHRFRMRATDLFDYKGGSDTANSARIRSGNINQINVGEVIKIPSLCDDIAAAPASIELPSDMNTTMNELWLDSIKMSGQDVFLAPNESGEFHCIKIKQIALEHGGSIAYKVDSQETHMNRTGSGTTGTFTPDLSADTDNLMVGTYHTHPYTRFTDGLDNDAACFSGGDIAVSISDRTLVDLVQSGEVQFATIRTKKTPGSESTLEAEYDAEFDKHDDFNTAILESAKWVCNKYGYALYKGTGGNLAKQN
tara:strand:+ start:628 stop:1464 length:837 start_codon:yes stop_codon:yes gene_type:complete